MENDKKTESGNVSYNNCQIFNGDIHGGNFSMYGGSGQCSNQCEEKSISKEVMAKAIKEVQKMFWGQSSYAVIFCAMRDYFGYGDNASLFEDDIDLLAEDYGFEYLCPANTIASTFYNNDYLKLNVNKWEDNHVRPRSILLVKAFKKAVEALVKQQ